MRAGPPGLGLMENTRFDLRALHAAPDWASLPFLEQGYVLFNRRRLYACTCLHWTAERVEPIENDHELESEPNLPWGCRSG